MGAEMDLEDVIEQERTLARSTARMPFSPSLTIYYSQRRFGTAGELYLTERYIGFRGSTTDFRIKVIVLSLVLFIVGFSQVLLALMATGDGSGSFLFESPNSIFYWIILGSLIGLIILSLKRERRLSRGFVWPRDGVGITVSGKSLLILENEGLTRIDFDDDSGEVERILGDYTAEFEISDLSGLDYHEKVEILEQRYKQGKLTRELYEELKKRLPYL